jgi:hypothetical protein
MSRNGAGYDSLRKKKSVDAILHADIPTCNRVCLAWQGAMLDLDGQDLMLWS